MRVTKRGNTYQYDFYYKGKRYRKGGYISKKLAMTAMSLKQTELVEGFDVGQKISFVQYYKHLNLPSIRGLLKSILQKTQNH
ncbi:hypothetical protein [Staphylococcus ursi]|uniref:hypothetical protein n=1 Tax=Staphylococcus sp. MI 10-1553 TaxID=1912064 RepID=UPI001EF0C01E|nr:hypothetical protein [Staphylococcus sp. MI 10-1553]